MTARFFYLARLLSVLSLSLSLTPPPEPQPALTSPVRAASAIISPSTFAPSLRFPTSPADTPTYEDEVMMLVNEARWENGELPPLKRDDLLDTSSELHSDNMGERDFFAHCDPDTGMLSWDRMEAAGYNWNSAAENIAAGYSNPAAVMAGWMDSSGHRANILSTSYRELGIGYVYQTGDQGNVRLDQDGNCTPDAFNYGPYFSYWTQNFGRRNAVYPVVIEREAFDSTSAQVMLYIYGGGTMTEMRFKNETDAWTAWEPFQSERSWTLSPGNGLKSVHAEVRNSGGTVYQASDIIWLEDPGGPPPTPNLLPTSTFTPTASPFPSPTPIWSATPGPSPTPSLSATPAFWTDQLYLPVVRR